MGLDMYLRARKYVSGYKFQRNENDPEVNEYDRLVELFGMKDFTIEDSPSAYVEFTIGYWRKANHIHEWFVQNVQDGVDECQPANVSRDQLRELREICLRVLASTSLVPGEVRVGMVYSKEHPKGIVRREEGKIVADPSVAEELLPTSAGFFFGSTDFDEWYWKDIERTVEVLDKALALLDNEGYWNIIYQSSW